MAPFVVVTFVTSMRPTIPVTRVDAHIVGEIVLGISAVTLTAVFLCIVVAAIVPSLFVLLVRLIPLVASVAPLLLLISTTTDPLLLCNGSVQLVAQYVEFVLHGREHIRQLSILLCQCCNE